MHETRGASLIVQALEEARGETGLVKGSRAQMAYLGELRNSKNLREIVWEEFVATGELERASEQDYAEEPEGKPTQPDAETQRMTVLGTDERADIAVAVPEAGQIVNVRGSVLAVTDVQVQGLPRSGADDAVAALQHAVTLQSVEEDRLGQELRVIWELEPGRSLRPESGLPQVIDAKRFDSPSRLAAFIDALRWGAITSADSQVVQAPFRSGANMEAYQLEPLRRALRGSRANLLLASGTLNGHLWAELHGRGHHTRRTRPLTRTRARLTTST